MQFSTLYSYPQQLNYEGCKKMYTSNVKFIIEIFTRLKQFKILPKRSLILLNSFFVLLKLYKVELNIIFMFKLF